MHCIACGAGLAEGAAFCATCGAPQGQPQQAPPPRIIYVQRSQPAEPQGSGLTTIIKILVIVLLLGILVPTCVTCGTCTAILGSSSKSSR